MIAMIIPVCYIRKGNMLCIISWHVILRTERELEITYSIDENKEGMKEGGKERKKETNN